MHSLVQQKPRRLSGLGEINYRNIGLTFAVGICMEIRKELDPKSKQFNLVTKVDQALSELLRSLPDEVTERQVTLSCGVFLEMEKYILKYSFDEYRGFLSPLQREELYDMLSDSEQLANCGSDYC